jgi:thioredoxin reductase (NADPH)
LAGKAKPKERVDIMMYDSLIIGGGIAGLQAAIQLGRYEHKVLVVDKGYGRSTLCRSYHNILGWPDGVSGDHLRELGRQHAAKLGVEFIEDEVIQASKQTEGFSFTGSTGQIYEGLTVLLATGIIDRFPQFEGLVSCLGKSIYVCPDCDGFEIKNKRTIVMGSGNTGANMAAMLSYWTDDIVFINHEHRTIDQEKLADLKDKQINVVDETISEVLQDHDGVFNGVTLSDGSVIKGEKGFIAFGGNKVKSELASQLSVELMENRHIITDPRSKMTSVPNVWAAGDIGVHSEQLTIAMGEGSQSAIWMHKALMKLKNKKPVTV